MTPSADFQNLYAAGQNHIGEGVTREIAKTMNLCPGEHHSLHVSRIQSLMKISAFRKRCLELENFELAYVIEKKT
jgi:hypothetical protein